MKYFEKFLELIKQDFNLKQDTRNMYIADCKISMASCNMEFHSIDKAKAYPAYLDAWETIKLIKGQNTPNFEF